MLWRPLFISITAFVVISFASLSAAWGGQISFAGAGITTTVSSMKELRNSRVVRQNYDFSCGSAAVATLLTFSYDKPTTEETVFRSMYSVGDQESIRKVGFSLLDMQKYMTTVGYRAEGYKISLNQLHELKVPLITLISPGGYNHFVVLRGWDGGSLIVADSQAGLRRMSVDDFHKVWNGVVFVLVGGENVNDPSFNDPEDIKVMPRAYFDVASGSGSANLTSFFLSLRGFRDY